MILALSGLLAGVLAGFLGIGGGSLLVPILVTLGNEPVQSVAISNLAIAIISLSGSIQNWRMGKLNLKRVFYLSLPALITAQIGVYFANQLPSTLLLTAFGILLLVNVYLVGLRKKLTHNTAETSQHQKLISNSMIAKIAAGSLAGLLAGLFGVGGGVIIVPLQIVFLGETIKVAIQTSLGVICITAISATMGHSFHGNVLFTDGIILGIGGIIGSQFSTRMLPKLPDKVILFAFRIILASLSIYILYKANS